MDIEGFKQANSIYNIQEQTPRNQANNIGVAQEIG